MFVPSPGYRRPAPVGRRVTLARVRGRSPRSPQPALISPLQGAGHALARVPGRCPGLSDYGLSGRTGSPALIRPSSVVCHPCASASICGSLLFSRRLFRGDGCAVVGQACSPLELNMARPDMYSRTLTLPGLVASRLRQGTAEPIGETCRTDPWLVTGGKASIVHGDAVVERLGVCRYLP
jgi:hypothetical protein